MMRSKHLVVNQPLKSYSKKILNLKSSCKLNESAPISMHLLLVLMNSLSMMVKTKINTFLLNFMQDNLSSNMLTQTCSSNSQNQEWITMQISLVFHIHSENTINCLFLNLTQVPWKMSDALLLMNLTFQEVIVSHRLKKKVLEQQLLMN